MTKLLALAALMFLAVFTMMAQTALSPHDAVKCAGLDGKACTWAQVADLSAAAAAAPAYKALSTFGRLTLASFDGTLKCAQADGTVCTADQVRAVVRIAEAMKLRVWLRFGDALSSR